MILLKVDDSICTGFGDKSSFSTYYIKNKEIMIELIKKIRKEACGQLYMTYIDLVLNGKEDIVNLDILLDDGEHIDVYKKDWEYKIK